MGIQYPHIFHSILRTKIYLEKYIPKDIYISCLSLIFLISILQYRLSIRSNSQCPSKMRLTLKKDRFMLGFPEHSFTVKANGYTLERVFWSDIDYYFQHYNWELFYFFIGSDILIEIDVPQGFFFFNISYLIVDSGKVKYLLETTKKNSFYSNTHIRF